MNLQPASFTCQRVPGPLPLFIIHGRTDKAVGSWQCKMSKQRRLSIELVIKEYGTPSAIRHLQAQRFLLMQWLSGLCIECDLSTEKGARVWISIR